MAKALKDQLSQARQRKGVSLREVENETGVSNAYVSQLESGAAKEPSPHKLYALASYYGIDYGALMQAAGYVLPTEAAEPKEGFLFMGESLTDAEAGALAAALKFFREQSRSKKEK